MAVRWQSVRRRTLRLCFVVGVFGYLLTMIGGLLGSYVDPLFFIPMAFGAVVWLGATWKASRVSS